jgi:hypothetical protein
MEYPEAKSRASNPAMCKCSLFPLPQQYVLFRQGITLFPRKAPFDITAGTTQYFSQLANRTFQSKNIQGPSHISTGSVIASVLVRCGRRSHRTGILNYIHD